MTLLTDVPADDFDADPLGHPQHHRDLATAVLALQEAAAGEAISVRSSVITLTPSNLTDSVTIPAGGWLLDWALDVSEAFDVLVTTLNIGDGDDSGGFVVNADLNALGVMTFYWSDAWTAYDNSAPIGNALGPYFDTNVYTRSVRRYPAGGAITVEVGGAPVEGSLSLVVVYAVPDTAAAPSGLQTATVTLSSADILALDGTRVTAVAAVPGAYHIIRAIDGYMVYDSAYYGGGDPKVYLTYEGQAAAYAGLSLSVDNEGDAVTAAAGPGSVFASGYQDATFLVGKALEFAASEAITDGDSPVTVNIEYVTRTVPA